MNSALQNLFKINSQHSLDLRLNHLKNKYCHITYMFSFITLVVERKFLHVYLQQTANDDLESFSSAVV